MNPKLKIEKNVPIPTFGGRRSDPNSVSATIRKLKVGESVVLSERQRQAAFAAAHTIKFKLTSRLVGHNQVRVWRIK